jgi:hypothetical protein
LSIDTFKTLGQSPDDLHLKRHKHFLQSEEEEEEYDHHGYDNDGPQQQQQYDT